jgi:hypothetical protein
MRYTAANRCTGVRERIFRKLARVLIYILLEKQWKSQSWLVQFNSELTRWSQGRVMFCVVVSFLQSDACSCSYQHCQYITLNVCSCKISGQDQASEWAMATMNCSLTSLKEAIHDLTSLANCVIYQLVWERVGG